MNVDNLLHRDKAFVRRAVLEKLGKNEANMENEKKLLVEWFENQRKLPEIPGKCVSEVSVRK